ncbi:hypothetical protein CQW23_24264 [Capsicum baccatum]|uniref:Protein phosphatase n=1 Tax=Capsicum baccatum TaxID=33114 RepID=A0A2G2VUB6_CAPBA|nr:hypothetical protein CQW23_24264 [Capsicum baccatum]
MVAASLYLPKENPTKPLGEDAPFIHELNQTIGVADGVGGWIKEEIDAGIYARELMNNSLIATDIEPTGDGNKVEKDNEILAVETDGMLDNVNESEIEEIVRRGMDEKLKAKELASQIGNIALYNSFDRFADTPFSRAVERECVSQIHKGGKIDDITVIVAYIQ